jgi:DNA-binding PadR family transcriptional regulator
MRTLKYAILGLINREPMTGYDITKEFNSNVLANFWYANHSQVYPELSKLIDEGSISFEVVIQGEKLEKKLYTITEKGRKDLMKWLVKDDPLEATPKDIFRLRAYFSDFLDLDELSDLVKQQKLKHLQKLESLQRIMDRTYPVPPSVKTREFGDFIVLESAIMREKYYINWLDDYLSHISRA